MRFLVAGRPASSVATWSQGLRPRTVHEVTRPGRGPRPAAPDQVRWDPAHRHARPRRPSTAPTSSSTSPAPRPPGNPHSKTWARELLESRVSTTRVLAEAIARHPGKPAFLAQNGVGWLRRPRRRRSSPRTSDSRGDAFMTRRDAGLAGGRRRPPSTPAPACACCGRRRCSTAPAPPLKQHAADVQARSRRPPRATGGSTSPSISLRDWVGRGDPRRPRRIAERPGQPVRARARPPTPSSPRRSPGRCTARRSCACRPFVIKPGAGRMAHEVLGSLNVVARVPRRSGLPVPGPRRRRRARRGA